MAGSSILAYQGGCGLTAAAEKDIGGPNICLLKKALSKYGMQWYNLVLVINDKVTTYRLLITFLIIL
jgi:hypothetical protein